MGYCLCGKYQVYKTFMSNISAECGSNWLSDELAFPGFSRGLGSWRGLVSDTVALSTYRSWALAIFSVYPNDDTPCMANMWNAEQVLTHFLLQSCWRCVPKIWFCMWKFCIVREGGTAGWSWHSEWAFGKLIWSSYDLMQFLQNVIQYTEKYSQGQLQVFYTGQQVFGCSCSPGSDLSLSHMRRLASWKSLKICQDKYLCKWWYRVFILYLIYNAFTLT